MTGMQLKTFQIDKRVRLTILLVLVLAVAVPAYVAFEEFRKSNDPVVVSPPPPPPLWGWVNWGGWDYSVLIKPNDINIATVLGPGEEYYDALVEGIKARFSYTMATDAPARIEGWYEIATDLALGDQFSEHSLVVPRTFFVEQDGTNVSLELDIDIDREKHLNRLQQIAQQAGLNLAEEPVVIFTATVNVNVVADGGSTNQTVSPTLIVPLRGSPAFTVSGERSVYDNGVVRSKSVEIPAVSESAKAGKLYSLMGVVLAALLPVVFGLSTTSSPRNGSTAAAITVHGENEPLAESEQRNPPVSQDNQPDREIRRIKRKYRKRIAQGKAGEWLPGREAVPVESMDDLVRVADEVLKPIIYSVPVRTGEPHVFYTIDGPTRYEFRVS